MLAGLPDDKKDYGKKERAEFCPYWALVHDVLGTTLPEMAFSKRITNKKKRKSTNEVTHSFGEGYSDAHIFQSLRNPRLNF